MKICIDPGHGNWSRKRGSYDPGAECKGRNEASIVMVWANALKAILEGMGHQVVRTRVDAKDPAPVWRRDDIARAYECVRMVSLHCNAFDGKANGTETFYRGEDDKAMAKRLNDAVCKAMGTANRGVKTEKQSQHSSLAVMEFDKCWLIELAFIDHDGDAAKLVDPVLVQAACKGIAEALTK